MECSLLTVFMEVEFLDTSLRYTRVQKEKINSPPVVCYKLLTWIVEDHTNVYRDIDISNNMAGS